MPAVRARAPSPIFCGGLLTNGDLIPKPRLCDSREQVGELFRVFMQLLNAHERKLTGLARGVRAAIVLPLLFALSFVVIGQPVMAGFAVFGTFAHLVMVDYSSSKGARLAESGTLTALGAVLVTLGTIASTNLWLAMAGAVTAGLLSRFPAEWPASAQGQVSALRPALLMTFMLAVAVPTPLHSLPPQLCGWLLAGLVAQVALRLLWIPIRSVDLAAPPDTGFPAPLGNAICAGAAMGLAVLMARLLRLDHAFWVVLGVAPVLTTWKTSPTHTFWRQQAGTLLGFSAGALLVASVGAHQAWYWILLPCIVFISAYLSSAVGFVAGQAGFTAFAVVLFCILTPLQRHVGIVRVEDIAIGGAISLLVGSFQHIGAYFKRRA
jgi:fusaric acid resistance family protein